MDSPDSTITVDTSPSGPVPTAEAFAHAMALTGHQHAAAVGKQEDAVPTQARLPIPRPAFDYAKAWRQLGTKKAELLALKVAAKDAEKAYKKAKHAVEEAQAALDAMDDQLRAAERESLEVAEPADQVLPFAGKQPCSWERAHPGEVCHICADLREGNITSDEAEEFHLSADAINADEIAATVAADEAAAVGFVVHMEFPAEKTRLYFKSAHEDGTAEWTEHAPDAHVFASEQEAIDTLTSLECSPDGFSVISAAATAEAFAADEQRVTSDEPPDEPPAEPTADPAATDSATMDPEPVIGVGTIAKAVRDIGNFCIAGEPAVCYEVYTIGNRPGYSFIFAGGSYDGFSPIEVRQLLTLTGEVDETIAGYTFTNVVNLMRDYRAGIFAQALKGGSS